MATEEKPLSEKESLELIASMINKAKNSYHEKGIGPVLWGSIITLCSLVTFLQIQYDFELPFDIWLLTLFALVPQVYLSIKGKKLRKTKSYNDDAIDYVWICFGVAIFLLIHINSNLVTVLNNVFTDYRSLGGKAPDFNYFNYSSAMMLLLYGIPTVITGGIMRFKPMLYGGILCWVCCVISVYTDLKIDMLLTALAATFAWLVPGIILWRRYKKGIACNV
jgi:hypothetical protein